MFDRFTTIVGNNEIRTMWKEIATIVIILKLIYFKMVVKKHDCVLNKIRLHSVDWEEIVKLFDTALKEFSKLVLNFHGDAKSNWRY